MKVSGHEYLRHIDGLRAIAVGIVLIFHLSPSILPSGFIGVDIFFVISGYLITGIVAKEIQAGRFAISSFYAKRARRLLPALLVVLLASAVLGYLILFPTELKNFGVHIASAAGFVTNLALLNETGYFDNAAHGKPLLHLWSLSVEEQFYLVWPLLLLAARKRLGMVISAIGLVSAAFYVYMQKNSPEAAFYILPSRMWELAFGAWLATSGLVASLRAKFLRGNGELLRSAVVYGLMGVLLAIIVLYKRVYSDIYVLMFGTVIVSGLLITLASVDAYSRWMLASRLPVFFGKISYPLYLWHWPLLAFYSYLSTSLTPGEIKQTKALLALLAVVLAYVTWRYVERPVQERYSVSVRQDKRKILCASGLVLALVLAIGGTFYFSNGLPGRYDQEVNTQVSDLDQFKARWGKLFDSYQRCAFVDEQEPDLKKSCKLAKLGAPTIFLWGDSHAQHLLPGLSTLLARSTEVVGVIGKHGCPPLLGVEVIDQHELSLNCAEVNRKALGYIHGLPSVRLVILSARSSIYIEGEDISDISEVKRTLVPTVGHGQTDGDNLGIFSAAFERTVETLIADNKRVLIVLPVPELSFHPASCVARNLNVGLINTSCSMPLSGVMSRQSKFRSLVQMITSRNPSVLVYDPVALLCRNGVCPVKDGERMLYLDNNHLSIYGSERVGEDIIKLLREKGVDVADLEAVQ